MLIPRLQRVNDAQHLGGIPAGRGWVREDKSDGLLGVYDEDAADREGDTLLVNVGRILVVQHIIGIGHFALFVANDRESEIGL